MVTWFMRCRCSTILMLLGATLFLFLLSGRHPSFSSQNSSKYARLNQALVESRWKEYKQGIVKLTEERKATIRSLNSRRRHLFLNKEEWQDVFIILGKPEEKRTKKQKKRLEKLVAAKRDREVDWERIQLNADRLSDKDKNTRKFLKAIFELSNREVEDMKDQASKEFSAQVGRFNEVMTAKLLAAVKQVAEQGGYDLVIEQRALFYAKGGSEDISSEVLLLLNSQSADEG